MSELEEELKFLTKIYVTYRNIVFKLRELYSDSKPDITSENRPEISGNNFYTSESRSFLSETKPNVSTHRRRNTNHSKGYDSKTAKTDDGSFATSKKQNRGKKEGAVEEKKPYKREAL
jgi:hypothetical protein